MALKVHQAVSLIFRQVCAKHSCTVISVQECVYFLMFAQYSQYQLALGAVEDCPVQPYYTIHSREKNLAT